MIDKTKLYEALSNFIDGVATEEEEIERNSIKSYMNDKSKLTFESMTGRGSKIKMEGDDVFVNDKKVGTVKSDLDNDGGISFAANENEKPQNFGSVEDLYEFLGKNYVNETISAVSPKLREGKAEIEKALTTQSLKKSERAQRFSSVLSDKGNSDSKVGDMMHADVRKQQTDPVRGGSDTAYPGKDMQDDEEGYDHGGYEHVDLPKKHNS